MSTTHKVVLKKKYKTDKDGYLNLRTTKDRRPTYTPLGFKVQVSNWNADKQYVKSREPDADKINDKIQEVLAQAQINTVHKKKVIKGKSFVKYAQKIIKVIPQEGTRRGKQNALGKLKDFLKSIDKEDIAFEKIDTFFINEYYGYLLDNVANSSANEYLTVFKYFLKHADAHGYHSYSTDPFKNFRRKKELTEYDVMKDDEVKKFFAYKPEKEDYYLVQQGFGFMMYASGMRISDFITLKWKHFYKKDDNYVVKFNMSKTNKPLTTQLSLEALQFLIPFIEGYDKDAINSYRLFEKKQNNLKRKLKQAIEEESQIELRRFSEFKYDLLPDVMDKWHKLVQQESKKEERKVVLQQSIIGMKRDLEFNRKTLVSTIGDEILKLKKKHPNDTVTPMLREGSTYSESHNLKMYFNHRLEMIQKKSGIETKIRNHQARHVFAQRLFEAGVNYHNISLALGHTTLETTENYRRKLITAESMNVTEEFSKVMRDSL